MMTVFYSILHFLVDGICASAMFSRFLQGTGALWWMLTYNFCAFVLQMPFGALLDSWNTSTKTTAETSMNHGGICSDRYKAFFFALAGVLLTIAGAFTSPVVLGIGNALFHAGGGVGTIFEDRACGSAGRRLGIFVAPGAMGLYLGTIAAKSSAEGKAMSAGMLWVIGSSVVAVALMTMLWRILKRTKEADQRKIAVDPSTSTQGFRLRQSDLMIITGCFVVVVLRSYVGMAVAMPWKTTIAAGLLATAAVVLGKMAGGFAAAAFGRKRTVLWSLFAAAVCYAFSGGPVFGVLALFLFNMTMPVTLQILVDRYQNIPGTMFGLLTVGLFLGFLPVFFSLSGSVSGGSVGAVLSLVSLAVLLAAAEISERPAGGTPQRSEVPASEIPLRNEVPAGETR